MPTEDQFLEAAWLAAPRFGLDPISIAPLSHSENVVVAVTDRDGTRVAMRLHRPGYNTVDELRSEVALVRSLGAFGLPVPTAVPTVDGDHYVPIEVGGMVHQVGVVEWVAGQPLGGPNEAEDAGVVAHYGRIGEAAATIRAHHATWVAPPGFRRRSWDLDGLLGPEPLWGRFWEVAALTDGQRRLLARCRDALRRQLGALATTPDRYGLIHADLHLGNCMVDGETLTVIDFDDAGHGWFVQEVAVALHPVLDEPWEAEARAALLDGYRRVHPFDPAEEELIDSFVTMRCLSIVGWLDARRELPIHEAFPDVVAQAERAADRYLTRVGAGRAS